MIKLKKILSDKIKKNLLDIDYQRNLQYFTTTIIITFTYFIGVVIAFLTKQINYKNINQMVLFVFITIVFFIIIILFLRRFRSNLNEIPKQLEKLKV